LVPLFFHSPTFQFGLPQNSEKAIGIREFCILFLQILWVGWLLPTYSNPCIGLVEILLAI
ncbi:MAG: hypothetical protein ACK452_14550, partial [Bacteroidota bacterium]